VSAFATSVASRLSKLPDPVGLTDLTDRIRLRRMDAGRSGQFSPCLKHSLRCGLKFEGPRRELDAGIVIPDGWARIRGAVDTLPYS
jgi:hypothetical protein